SRDNCAFLLAVGASTEIYTLSLHDALPICRVRNRRQLNSLQNTWPYGYSMPIAVRYTQDAFSRSGWLWPVDAKGEPLKATRPQRSEERFSRNAETDLVCRLLLEKKKHSHPR